MGHFSRSQIALGNEKMFEEYNQEQKKAESFLLEGLKEGRRKAVEATAHNLLSLGVLSIEQIAMTTSLPVEQVQELSN